jgi:putative transposase
MMPNYRRAFVPGGCWFFTVNLLERRNTLLVDRVDALRAAVEDTRRRYPFVIDAVVVLPDHIHAVWTLPPGDADFSVRWRLIKSRFARALPRGERLGEARMKHGLVTKVRDWPHSSFHRDVRAGIVPDDWAGEVDTIGEFGEPL